MPRPLRVHTTLPVPCQAAFAFAADPRNDPQWVNTTPEVWPHDTRRPEPEVGAKYGYKQSMMRPVEGTIEITAWDPPRHAAYHVHDPLRVYDIEYHFQGLGDSHTRFTQTSHPTFRSRSIQRMSWAVRPLIRRQQRRQMRHLRRRLRRRSQP